MLLEAKGIYKSYGSVEILKGIDLEIPKNKITTITGASGAGKSTLLQILGTLDQPDGGRVNFNGMDITSLSKKELSIVRNQDIGFVFQFHNLLPEFTALENVMMPGMFNGGDKKKLKERAQEILRDLGLDHRYDHKPSEMSGGEQQRVAVARSLINEPQIVFADEPSGNLDSKNADALHQLFFDLSVDKCAFVIVTHNESLAEISHHNLSIVDGSIFSRN